VSGSVVHVTGAGTTLTASNVSMGAGAVLDAFNGAMLIANNLTMGANVLLAAFTGATLTMSGGTIGAGDAVGTLGGTANIIGSVTNSGSLQVFAPGLLVLGGVLSNTKGGILATGSGAVVELEGATILGGKWQTVSGALVETASGSTNVISSATIVSGSIIEVTDGGELTLSGAIANSGTFEVSAAASAATLELGGATLSGGKLETIGASALIETVSGSANVIHGGTIVSGSRVGVVSAGTLTLSGGSVGAGATVSATSGSTLIVSGMLADSGTLDLSGVTSVAAHATLAALSGGSAIVTGTVVNSGTFNASGAGSLIKIGSGGVVSGGAVVVGNGIVDVLSGGSANVAFLSNGSGGLEIADSNVNSSTFTGKISGFGGVGHSNHKQFIDLVSVTSALNTISLSYVSAASHTSGTLFVSSGGAVVAAINIIGAYTSANFSAKADGNNNVEIIDPTVPNGGSVQTFPQHGLDLPDIAFGAQTTRAYAENNAGTGGTLTVSDGRHAASIALLGNYMAGSFVTAADGHGGTLLAQTLQTEQQPLLTHPRP
jgi:fibronectin-binding autotransporter adhesin